MAQQIEPDGGSEQVRNGDEGLIAAIRESDAHEDVAEYANLARDQGGTPILASMRHFHENSSVSRIGEIGTQIERTLWKDGAVPVLAMGHLDEINREILSQIAPEGC